LITNGSVIRAVMDYVYIALKNQGKIMIGDAPIQSADFLKLTEVAGINQIITFYKSMGMEVSLIDFRQSISHHATDGLLIHQDIPVSDSNRSLPVNLGKDSLLNAVSKRYQLLRVTNYNPNEMGIHHNTSVNEYLISRTILNADVVINLPKLKTHRKVGITCALKNLVGINAHKDWLPHHRVGSIAEGGDEYLFQDGLKSTWSKIIDDENRQTRTLPRRLYYYSGKVIRQLLKIFQKDPFYEGSWYGNDTAWRMALDLNRILLYASKQGMMQDTPQRKVFTVVDGIIAGEKEGPLEPTAKPVGVLVAGLSSTAVDTVIARLIGFDYRKIPIIREAYNIPAYPITTFSPDQIHIKSNIPFWQQMNFTSGSKSLQFEASLGWKGHVELDAKG
jgi:uncharacterized protein (DUF362 family)